MESRNHTAIILVLVIVLELVLYNGLLLGFGISSKATMIISGLAIWSICTAVVSERVGCRWISLKDYSLVNGLGFGILTLVAAEGLYALVPDITEPSLFVIVFAALPVAAIQGIVRRVQFSREEREALRELNRWPWARSGEGHE